MSQAAHIAERRQQMLAKLAELDLVATEAAHASYLAAIDTPEEAEKGRTYQRMGRSLRQSLALHERFEHNAVRRTREDAEAARREAILNPPVSDDKPGRQFPRDIEAANQRADDLRTAVRRVIWTEGFEKSELESEHELAGDCYRQLEEWLLDERCDDDFFIRPLDEHVAEICAAMGLNPENAARWRELPEVDLTVVKTWIDDLTGYAKPPWEGRGRGLPRRPPLPPLARHPRPCAGDPETPAVREGPPRRRRAPPSDRRRIWMAGTSPAMTSRRAGGADRPYKSSSQPAERISCNRDAVRSNSKAPSPSG